MVGPVAQGRQLARQFVQFTAQELAEAAAGQVQVLAVAVAEVHGHVEQVVHVALEAEAVLEHEVEHAGAVGVGVGPDVRAVAEVTVGLAVGERRIGEQRGGDGLQRQRDAELLHHVRFAGEVQVHLHGAGAGHHVQAQVAALGHVLAHDLVAALGHPRHFIAAPLGLETHAQETQAQLVADGLDLAQVGHGFAAGVVDVLEHGAGKFQLAGRFQRHRCPVLGQGDELAVFFVGLPAEAGEPAQQRLDATFAVPGGRAQVVEPEAELLVLGADAPVLRRPAACRQVVDQHAVVGQWFVLGVAGSGQRGS